MLIKFKPITPGLRGTVLVSKKELSKEKPHKTLTKKLSSTGGRNNQGRITSRRMGGGVKRKYRLIDFKRSKTDISAEVIRNEYDPNRSAFISLIKYDDGELNYILSPKNVKVGEKIIKTLKFRSNQTIISFISTITISSLKKMIKVKAQIVRAIPLPPISLKKGPVPICPPNKKVKNFFNKIGSTVEIKNEKLSINFWSTSGMMAAYYEILRTMSEWLVTKGVKRTDAQKYITSLFLALSEDAVVNSKTNLKNLVKESQTPKGLNEQGLKEMSKKGVYKNIIKTLNMIYKRLN